MIVADSASRPAFALSSCIVLRLQVILPRPSGDLAPVIPTEASCSSILCSMAAVLEGLHVLATTSMQDA